MNKTVSNAARDFFTLPPKYRDKKHLEAIIQRCVDKETIILCNVLADIREKTGVGVKPMLTELADAIVNHIPDTTKMVAPCFLDDAAHLVTTFEGKTFGEQCDVADWLVSAISKAMNDAYMQGAKQENKA